jgi:hypothetical protein
VYLSDTELIDRLHLSRAKEKEIVVLILNDLLEVESRGIYLKRSFSSMYKFCLHEMGYSENEALLRLRAMRLMQVVPEVEQKIEAGFLSLTNAAEVGRQMAKESVRRKKNQENPLRKQERLDLIKAVENVSTREGQRRLAKALPEIQEVGVEKTKVLRDEKTLIQFVADSALNAKLDRIKEVMAHKNFSGRYDLLFNEMADVTLKFCDPLMKPSKASDAAPLPRAPKAQTPKVRSRGIRITIRREVFQRANGQCEYVDPILNKRCDCRHGVEVDHIQRFSEGGTHELGNLRLLCDAHNRGREKYELDF